VARWAGWLVGPGSSVINSNSKRGRWSLNPRTVESSIPLFPNLSAELEDGGR
jgi:hypothetical protein